MTDTINNQENDDLLKAIYKSNLLEKKELESLGYIVDDDGRISGKIQNKSLFKRFQEYLFSSNPNQQLENNNKMSRREFLKFLAMVPVIPHLDTMQGYSLGNPESQETLQLSQIPPSIMFHARSKQMKILPALIEYFKDQGYTFTTYATYYSALERGEVIEKPIILTFDDLTMVNGSSNFEFYKKNVVEKLQYYGICGVFGVITEPVVIGTEGTTVHLTEQNDDYWAMVRDWVETGVVELATHTQSHPNLDRSMPTDVYLREIKTRSADIITDKTGVKPTTLITPYGSGVTQEGTINPLVLEACAAAGINFVVGIAGMRKPVPNVAQEGKVVYAVGRVMPVDGSEHMQEIIQRECEQWTLNNQEG